MHAFVGKQMFTYARGKMTTSFAHPAALHLAHRQLAATFTNYRIAIKGKSCSASSSELIFKYPHGSLFICSVCKQDKIISNVDLPCENSSNCQNPTTSRAILSSISLYCALSLATALRISSHTTWPTVSLTLLSSSRSF